MKLEITSSARHAIPILLLLIVTTSSVSLATEAGKIHFLRKTGFHGSGKAYSIFIDGERVCKLSNKRFTVHEVEAGPHEIFVQFYGKEQKQKEKVTPLILEVEAGRDHYIQVNQEVGLFTSRATFQEITKGSADLIMPKLKGRDEDCI